MIRTSAARGSARTLAKRAIATPFPWRVTAPTAACAERSSWWRKASGPSPNSCTGVRNRSSLDRGDSARNPDSINDRSEGRTPRTTTGFHREAAGQREWDRPCLNDRAGYRAGCRSCLHHPLADLVGHGQSLPTTAWPHASPPGSAPLVPVDGIVVRAAHGVLPLVFPGQPPSRLRE